MGKQFGASLQGSEAGHSLGAGHLRVPKRRGTDGKENRKDQSSVVNQRVCVGSVNMADRFLSDWLSKSMALGGSTFGMTETAFATRAS